MKARAFRSLLLAAALAAQVAAQVTVEDEIVTSEVSLFDVKAESQQNLTAAMLFSMALPGMGHYYVDKPKSAFIYLSADMVSLFGAVVFNTLADNREKSARSYAVSSAGIQKPPSGEAYWRHVGACMDAAEYNESVELSRGSQENLYQSTETWWRWPDNENMEEYNAQRQKARNFRVASSFFVGALVVNRILSTVDLRVFGKKSLSSGVHFEASLTPDISGGGLTLRTDF